MAELIRHARSVSPWFIPNKGGDARDFHGITDISVSSSVDSEDVFVVGKKDRCAADKGIPEATASITQLERGEIGTYLTLANLDTEPVAGISLVDFSNALVDVVLYERSEFSGDIEQTVWLPKTAISSLNIDIADPEARVERSFDLVGDNKHELNYDNKILVHVKETVVTPASGGYIIDLTAFGIPATDPNNSGEYILRVDRTRAGETITLETTDYSFNNGTDEITITDNDAGDVFNIYYSTDAFGSGQDPTTVDSASPCFIKADSVTVLISDGVNEVELDLLTSFSASASINRIDEGVIGNEERILREIEDTPVDISLSGRVKDSTILEAFMGKLTLNHGITDINLYLENVDVKVLIYSDSTKTSFLIGYKIEGLSFTDDDRAITANEFGELTVSATSTDMIISTDIGNF